MKFQRIFTIFAVFAIIMSLIGCSSKSPETETGTDPIPATTPAQTTVSPTTTQPETTGSRFEETVLVDDDNCTVIIKGIDPDNLFGYTLNIYLENKTDKELMFSVDDVSVNGFMCDPFWASTVSPGKKANEQINFLESEFDKNGIQEVKEISFTLNIYDSNDWTDEYLVEKAFTVNP